MANEEDGGHKYAREGSLSMLVQKEVRHYMHNSDCR